MKVTLTVEQARELCELASATARAAHAAARVDDEVPFIERLAASHRATEALCNALYGPLEADEQGP